MSAWTSFLLLLPLLCVSLGDICRSIHCDCQPPMDPEDASCSGSFLEVIPQDLPPFIQNLSIRNTMIRESDSTLNHYDQLLHLDLGHNQIFSIQSHSFSRLSQLLTLNLESNRLDALGSGSLRGLSRLSSLNLRDNHLSEIHGSLFDDICGSLLSLDVSGNKLVILHPNMFDDCHLLSHLDLSFNHLISLEFLLRIPSLKRLNLDGNNLEPLKNSSPFRGLNNLEWISLNECQLQGLSEDFFEGLSDLRSLFLEKNRFRQLPFSGGRKLQQLIELRVGSNYLEKISTELQGMKALKRLFISGCESKGYGFPIDPDAFVDNLYLEELSISSCTALDSLPEGLLGELTHLRSLELKDVGLTTLSPLDAPWTSLQALSFSQTELTCDCSLTWALGLNYTDFSLLLEASNASCAGKEGGGIISSLDTLDCKSRDLSYYNPGQPQYYSLMALGILCGVFLIIGGLVYSYCYACRTKPKHGKRYTKRIDKTDISVITRSVSNPSEYKDVRYGFDPEESWPLEKRASSNFPDIKTSVL